MRRKKSKPAMCNTYQNELPTDAVIVKRIVQLQKHHFEPAEIEQLTIDYTKHHLTTYQLATKYNCNRETISKVLKKNGVAVTTKSLNGEQIEHVKHLYATGLTADVIAERFGIHASTIRETLRKAGVTMRHRHDYDTDKDPQCRY